MLTVIARNARGAATVNPARVTFRSSNSAVATVSSEGVVTGVGFGAATVTAWESSNASSMSVDAAGLAVAREVGQGPALVTAHAAEGAASLYLYVREIGRPATLRFAHAASGVGPSTFRSHHLAPVTLTYSQSVDLPVTSGEFYVETDGLQSANYYRSNYRGCIPPGGVLSLYATAPPHRFSVLTPALSTSEPVPADSVLLRFIQGSTFPVIRQRLTGERGLRLIAEGRWVPHLRGPSAQCRCLRLVGLAFQG